MNWQTLLISIASLSFLAACSSTKQKEVAASVVPLKPVVSQTAPVSTMPIAPEETVAVDPLDDPSGPLSKRSVFFAYDSSAVPSEYQDLISMHADYLKKHHQRQVVVEGNTDARGSREYNLALGQRRAESVKQAFEVLGVAENQLEAVSYGKEKPLALGSTEADFAKNRRADIVYK